MEIRKDFLPLAIPDISEEEIYEVVDTLKSGWISVGPKVKKFEEEFAHYHGVKHAIANSNCTTALLISAKVGGILANNTYRAEFIYETTIKRCIQSKNGAIFG